MKIYKTQSEVEADIVDGVLKVNDDVKFECSLKLNASLEVKGDISALDMSVNGDILAINISAMGNISAWDISAGNISAGDISVENISTIGNISAWDISAENISAGEISADGNILFYAVCFAYSKITCKSIKGSRKNARYFSLDDKVEIKK